MFVPQSAVLDNPISPTRFSTFPEVSRFRVLVADDQQNILLALRLLLAQNGYQVETANSPQTVVEALASRTFDVLLMDLNYARDTTFGREGMDLLDRLADDCLNLEQDPAESSVLTLLLELVREEARFPGLPLTLNTQGFRTRRGTKWTGSGCFEAAAAPLLMPLRRFDGRSSLLRGD